MAILYYPKGQILARLDATNPLYEQLIIANNPNTVLYFDTSSNANVISSSNLNITASWAQTASVTLIFLSNSLSSSYAATASIALNALGGGSGGMTNSQSYFTITTSSTNWITSSFSVAEQFVTIATASKYNFTSSNLPSASQVAYTSLYIANTATGTSSLAFPTDWVFMGYVPSSLSASRAAILSLKNFGGTAPTVAAFAVQY